MIQLSQMDFGTTEAGEKASLVELPKQVLSASETMACYSNGFSHFTLLDCGIGSVTY
jgi:hypothetical protein